MDSRDGSTESVSVQQGAQAADLGRRVGIVLVSCGIAIQGVMLVRGLAGDGGDAGEGAATLMARALSLTVYVLMVGAYLLRGERATSDSSVTARCVAVCATFLPFIMPLWPAAPRSSTTELLASAVLLVGLAGTAWALRHLWTSFSIIPQARTLVVSGPYRWVRHPLYTMEIIANIGMAMHLGRPYHWVVLALMVAGQVYRARREEDLLRLHVPGYFEYQARTAALVPGLR
jgi:protein-S-isoprenylcysteine O-methyltransferase Ste14